ncbi:hypothetical protein [Burkholderia diffusa]|uniref:hypothetical protein n=1 Tax=Burkholderia diffusa TaxID=488732 RepID=UPI002ABE577A|nr:hypothetical protein [Burkholderia diffusa]
MLNSTQREAVGEAFSLGEMRRARMYAIYKVGNLGDSDGAPAAGLWILEIRSAHPTRPFGAFHEDLLMRAEPGDARRERASPAVRQMLIATGPASGV